MTDADYKPICPFGVDNGEVDGLSPQECFVLGYELAMIDGRLKFGDAFECPIHSDNGIRIRAELERQKRVYDISWMPEDLSESWQWLKVERKQ